MKKLRRKIVIGVFLSALAVFMLTVLLVGTTLNTQMIARADALTKIMISHGGHPPEKSEYERLEKEDQLRLYDYDEDSPYRLRYFTARFSGSQVDSWDVTHTAAVDEETARKMSQSVLDGGRETGYYGEFRYRVSEDSGLIVFLDDSSEIESIQLLILILAIISLIFVLLITIVFSFLSKYIVKPFEENARMQKQFITDASHELKTPLAIISANAEVLAYKDGENEWIGNITEQVGRVSEMVNELLTLNRLEEVDEISDIEPVDLSELTQKTVSDFEEVFNSKGIETIYEIQPDIVINGNTDQLKRLISVLADNAAKYAAENGKVEVKLSKDTRHTYLTFFNSCEIDPDADYRHLFDRFYRPDSSRTSSTGGHGIGLSIAKRITILHNGTIEAVPSNDGLTFNVKLSNKLKATKTS